MVIKVASESGGESLGVWVILTEVLDVRGPVLITRLWGTGGTGGRVGILFDDGLKFVRGLFCS